MISRWKHPNIKAHAYGVLQGFGEIADGLVTVCSLGFLMSRFEITVSMKRARVYLADRIKKKERAK